MWKEASVDPQWLSACCSQILEVFNGQEFTEKSMKMEGTGPTGGGHRLIGGVRVGYTCTSALVLRGWCGFSESLTTCALVEHCAQEW